jgi:hypothetical protein
MSALLPDSNIKIVSLPDLEVIARLDSRQMRLKPPRLQARLPFLATSTGNRPDAGLVSTNVAICIE